MNGERVSLMTQLHPRWQEFLAEMRGEKMGCKGDHRRAREILAQMGGVDVDASLEYFAYQGAFCDCEIIYDLG